MARSMEKYDPQRYDQLVSEQHSRFPSITLPPEYAELFEINTLQVLIKLARYKFVARLLRKHDDVLEVGSGTGLGAIFLSQHARHVTGLEIKPHDHAAASAASRRANVVFLLQSLFDYDPEAKHDAVVALDVIEHLTVEVGDQFVRRMAHHCKSNGIVAIGTPSIHSYPYQSKYSQAAHVKCYDQEELTKLMDRHFDRTLTFSMNDEIVHTGHPKLAWYYIVIGFMPRATSSPFEANSVERDRSAP
jgi:2-polyprenyl-3-methyl-5-hydroxy-6-metoxy-1,4-benzoquinol methylase